MGTHENIKKTLNFVYDSWVVKETSNELETVLVDTPQYTLGNLLGDTDFRDEFGYFDFYERFFYEQLGYPRHLFTINKYKVSEVYDNPETKFYYAIKSHWSLHDIFSKTDLPSSINKCLSECDNIKFLYIREHEPENLQDITSVVNYFKNNNISDTKLIIVSNNPRIKQYRKSLNSNFEFFRTNLLQITSSSIWNELGSSYLKQKSDKFFSCFNKTPKEHRVATLIELEDRNILKNTNWSMLFSFSYEKKDFWKHFHYTQFDCLLNDVNSKKDIIEKFVTMDCKKSDYEENIKLDYFGFARPDIHIEGAGGASGGMMVPETDETHKDSYVSIITESCFQYPNSDVIHITEKSTRPFFYYQFPIILATKGHIKFMEEEFGLDFYRDIIDHSYNDIENDKERFQATLKEIERINDNQDLFKTFFKSNKERFEKNKQIVKNFPNNDQDIKYFLNNL